jgi:hypothetical protein
MLKYAEHPSNVLRITLIAAYAATQWKVSIMKFRMTLALALFSLSTASFANSLSGERTGYSA